jgi:hypothetical protein
MFPIALPIDERPIGERPIKMQRAGNKTAFTSESGLITGSKTQPPAIGADRAEILDLGGLVAGDFHADADFDDHRGGPGHVHFLRLKNSPFRGDVSSRFSRCFRMSRQV